MEQNYLFRKTSEIKLFDKFYFPNSSHGLLKMVTVKTGEFKLLQLLLLNEKKTLQRTYIHSNCALNEKRKEIR